MQTRKRSLQRARFHAPGCPTRAGADDIFSLSSGFKTHMRQARSYRKIQWGGTFSSLPSGRGLPERSNRAYLPPYLPKHLCLCYGFPYRSFCDICSFAIFIITVSHHSCKNPSQAFCRCTMAYSSLVTVEENRTAADGSSLDAADLYTELCQLAGRYFHPCGNCGSLP